MSLCADRGEAVAAEVADTLREAGVVGREDEVGAFLHDQLLGVGQADQAFQHEDVVVGDVELVAEELPQVGRHADIDRKTDHAAAPAALEGALEGADEVFRLFVDFHLAVAQDAENAVAGQLEGGRKDAVEEQQDELLQQHEADVVAGQPDEALKLRRHRQQRVEVLAAVGIVELEGEAEAEIGDEGERVGRIDRDRRQDREDIFEEAGFQPVDLAVGQLAGIDHGDAGFDAVPGAACASRSAGRASARSPAG